MGSDTRPSLDGPGPGRGRARPRGRRAQPDGRRRRGPRRSKVGRRRPSRAVRRPSRRGRRPGQGRRARPRGRRSTSPSSPAATTARPPPAPTPCSGPASPGWSPRCATRSRRSTAAALARLRAAGVEVESGLMADEARRLNGPYLKRLATGLPYVTAKWAMTLDGKTAAELGRQPMDLRAPVEGPGPRGPGADGRDPRRDRHRPGRRPRADRPPARPQDARPGHPRRLGQAPARRPARPDRPRGPRLGRRHRPGPAGSSPGASKPSAARSSPFPGEGPVPVVPLLEELGRRGVTNLLVEGGGTVLGAFLDAGAGRRGRRLPRPDHRRGLARLLARPEGSGFATMAEALRLDRHEVSVVDGDVRVRGTLAGPWRAVVRA